MKYRRKENTKNFYFPTRNEERFMGGLHFHPGTQQPDHTSRIFFFIVFYSYQPLTIVLVKSINTRHHLCLILKL